MNEQTPKPDAASEPADLDKAIIRDELDRRLRLFDELDDAAFGRFGRLDWVACTLLFFLLPLLIAWWFL